MEQWSMGRVTKASVGIPTIGTVECQPQNSFGFSQKGISCKRGWNLSGMGAVRSYVLWNTGCFFLRMAMENQSHPCHATLLLQPTSWVNSNASNSGGSFSWCERVKSRWVSQFETRTTDGLVYWYESMLVNINQYSSILININQY